MFEVVENLDWIAAAIAGVAAGRGLGAFSWRGERRHRRKTDSVVVSVVTPKQAEERRGRHHALIYETYGTSGFGVRMEGRHSMVRNGNSLGLAIVSADGTVEAGHIEHAVRQVRAWERAFGKSLKIVAPKKVAALWPK